MKIVPGPHCLLLSNIRIKTNLAASSFPFFFFIFQSKHTSQERDFFYDQDEA